jgi:hypothetical protein
VKRSSRHVFIGIVAAVLVVLPAAPTGASPGQSPEEGPTDPAVEVLATPNRMVNGDGGTHGKCMEIAGGGPSSYLIQMAPCRSYAHQGWTLRQRQVTLPNGNSVTAYRIESHDPDAAGDCVTYMGQAVQARMTAWACNSLEGHWFRNTASSGWAQLESVAAWYFDYLYTGNPAHRQCLDVHVDRTRTTNVVQTWACGPLNKGNQLFRVQSA